MSPVLPPAPGAGVAGGSPVAPECAAVVEALFPALCDALTLLELPAPLRDESRRVLLRLGPEAGVLLILADGQPRAERWSHREAAGQPQADATVRVDSVDTLRQLLTNPSSVPGLLIRRRLRLEGNATWLMPLMESAGAPDRRFLAFLGPLARSLDDMIAEAAGVPGRRLGAGEAVQGWVPDEASQECMSCGSPFTLLRRRHHCRGCGRLCCGACAPSGGPSQRCVPAGGLAVLGRRPPRLCSSCHATGAPPMFSFASSMSGNGSFYNSFAAGFAQAPALQAAAQRPPHPAPDDVAEAKDGVSALQEQLEQVRKDQIALAQLHVRQSVDGIWSATQFVALLIALLLLQWCLSALLVWIGFLVALHLGRGTIVGRNVHVFWAAFCMFVVYRLTKARTKGGRLDKKEVQQAWLAFHCIIARFLYEQITVLGGFWTKLGQQLSVNPVIPAPYLFQLKQLQDCLPPSPMSEILATLKEEFGPDRAAQISIDKDADPLGVASVAQVHKATWLPPGSTQPREIVVKVQHRGAARRFRQDLRAAAFLARIARRLDPEGFPDLQPILKTMREVTMNELDFTLEAANQVRAREAVQKAGVDILIPEVVPELVAQKAMAMDFVDGVRLGKLAEELPSADRARLVASLVDHYGVQFTIDGHFHADPHPGNLLVERSSGRLVVLDWGMCITIAPRLTDAYARLFFAIATSDLWLLTDVLEEIGISFKDGDVFEPTFFMATLRFALRDSKPLDMAKAEMHKAMTIGDDLYMKGPKRYQKSPVDVLTGDLIYFGKALELLYMVSSELGVSHAILQTLLTRAYGKLMGRPAHLRSSRLLPSLPPPQGNGRGPLELELQQLLRSLYDQGRILGAQLCVLDARATATSGHRGSKEDGVLADIAVGVRGWLDTEPVTSSTLFNLLDISKLGLALAILRLVDSGAITLRDHLADKWRGFPAAEEAGSPTVEQVLGHRAGLWWLLPPGVGNIKGLLDKEAMLSAWAKAPPLEPPGATQRYHHTSFGYLCAGIARHLAGRELPELWDELARAAADQSGGLVQAQDLLLTLPAHVAAVRPPALPAKAVSSAGFEEISVMLSKVGELLGAASPTPAAKACRELFGKEHLVDVSLFGRRGDVPAASMPGLQAFGTARATASLLCAAERGAIVSPELSRELRRSRRPPGDQEAVVREMMDELGHIMNYELFQEFGLGAQLVSPEVWGGSKPDHPDATPWGHLSQSGSAALLLPGPRPVAVALLVNMRETESAHGVAWEVLRVVERHLRAGPRGGGS